MHGDGAGWGGGGLSCVWILEATEKQSELPGNPDMNRESQQFMLYSIYYRDSKISK